MNKFIFKLIFRRLGSKPLYPAISILGLTIGFLATVIVANWASDEFSYDDHLNEPDRIYRFTVKIDNDETNFHWDFARSFYGWLKDMPEELPGIEAMTRFSRWRSGIAKYEEKALAEELFTADQTVVDLFSIDLISGNRTTCLTGPNRVIISESISKKFFGNSDPLDKTLYLYCSHCQEKKPYRVTGVFSDIPHNSHVHFNILSSVDNPDERMWWAYYYVKLNKNVNPDNIIGAFDQFALNYIDEKELSTLTPKLQEVTDIHLKSAKDRELEKNGSFTQVKIIIGLVLFVLLISLFNFFNLRYISLLKDLKSLKILGFAGARSRGIFSFLIAESLTYCIIASILTFLIFLLTFPLFNQFIGKFSGAGRESALHTLSLALPVLVFLSTLVGVLPFWIRQGSGHLKNMLSSSGQISAALVSGSRSGVLKTLVGLQYLSAFVMIIAVLVIHSQIKLFMDNTLGKNGEQLICLKEIPVQVINKYTVFKEELLKSPLIHDVTSSMEEPGYEVRDMTGFITNGPSEVNENKRLFLCPVDDNFFDFYDIPIVAGNDFPKFSGNDSAAENFILNEKALEYLGWEEHDAVGRPFRLNHQYGSKKMGRIVGIVQDFQPATMKEHVTPTVYMQKSYWLFSGHVRYDTSNTAASIAALQKTWNEIYPDFPLEYEFVDNMYKKVYLGEFQLRKISLMLCILALIISSTGLIGITGITYEVRTKEIGIRKVNGANTPKVIQWLLKDILIVVLTSLAIAAPLAWILSSSWLKNYVIRISPGIGIFLLAGGSLVLIALITVSWQTWKAATRNPVEALRYE